MPHQENTAVSVQIGFEHSVLPHKSITEIELRWNTFVMLVHGPRQMALQQVPGKMGLTAVGGERGSVPGALSAWQWALYVKHRLQWIQGTQETRGGGADPSDIVLVLFNFGEGRAYKVKVMGALGCIQSHKKMFALFNFFEKQMGGPT